jgi:ATP-dependent DNA helicase RecQ
MDALRILNQVFKYEEFRKGQEEIINATLDYNNKGILVVMPTGAGKSILYQLPALLTDGLTVVISPLISLMKDQIDFLKSKKIPAEFYNSSLSVRDKREVEFSLIRKELKLLYIAPERFGDLNFFKALKQTNTISLLAVDESHTISTWGHDFRPSYRELSKIIDFLEPKQVIALTATATKRVQKDICKQLNMPNAKKFIKGFYRPDLKLTIKSCTESSKYSYIIDKVSAFNLFKHTGIIYCPTRKIAEEIVDELKQKKIDSILYHAGLSDKVREKTQMDWFNNGGIIVATVAFGMGINKSDVRFVIHAGMPASIENYYQEIGRASRDGKGAECITFFNAGRDISLQKFFIDMSYPSRENIIEFWEWCCETADRNNLILKTQKEMSRACYRFMKESSIGGCISKLKEAKFIETIGTGKYKINIDLNINNFNFQELEEKRAAKLFTLEDLSFFMTNDKECRMLQILNYFDDYSYEQNCQKCDVCIKKLLRHKPV